MRLDKGAETSHSRSLPIAFTGSVAGNFVTGESVASAVTLPVSCFGTARAATPKIQHSKQQATSKTSGRDIVSIPLFLMVSWLVERREFLYPKTLDEEQNFVYWRQRVDRSGEPNPCDLLIGQENIPKLPRQNCLTHAIDRLALAGIGRSPRTKTAPSIQYLRSAAGFLT